MSHDKNGPAAVQDARLARAEPGDLPTVLGLLREASLPVDGVAEHFGHFWVARVGNELVGCVGMEPYGPSAFLRSLAVAARHRGRGLGRTLTTRLLEDARQRGVRQVFLLTETAADFFAPFGFERIDRDEADPAVKRSVEFATVCLQSAACMRLGL